MNKNNEPPALRERILFFPRDPSLCFGSKLTKTISPSGRSTYRLYNIFKFIQRHLVMLWRIIIGTNCYKSE